MDKEDHDKEHRIFELDEKWIYEVYLNEELDTIELGEICRRNGSHYVIKKADEGFVIYEIKIEVL